MSARLGTPPRPAIAAVALSIALLAACSAPATRVPSRTTLTPPSTPVPAAPAAAPATSAAVPAAVSASASTAPIADPSPQPSLAASTATVAPPATAARVAAPASAAPTPAPAVATPAPAGAIAVTLLDSAIKLDRSSASAGTVNFAIKNAGTVIHQLAVLRTDIPQDRIPNDTAQAAKVTQPGFIRETKDMPPGTSVTLSLVLAPGKYVLMCNQPAHYLVGMHTGFTIN